MKRILALLLALCLLFCLAACGNEDTTSDITSDISSTETTEESKETESTPESDITESTTESETPQNTTPTKPTESTTTTTNNKPTTTTKPNNTEPKDESTNNKNDTPTTSTPTQKPTEKPTEEKPYYVGFELISIERKSTKTYVDGMHIFDKIYGKNKMLQKGDVVTYKINMSNGGNDFTVVKSPIYGDFAGHDYTVNGNLLTITANGSYTEVDIYIKANTKNGRTETINLGYFQQLTYSGDLCAIHSSYMNELLKDYGNVLGMEYVSGYETGGQNRVVIPIPNNNNWLTEAIHAMENWKKMGLKKFYIVVIYDNAFDGCAY